MNLVMKKFSSDPSHMSMYLKCQIDKFEINSEISSVSSSKENPQQNNQ